MHRGADDARFQSTGTVVTDATLAVPPEQPPGPGRTPFSRELGAFSDKPMSADIWRAYREDALAAGGVHSLAFKVVRDMTLSPGSGLSPRDLSKLMASLREVPLGHDVNTGELRQPAGAHPGYATGDAASGNPAALPAALAASPVAEPGPVSAIERAADYMRSAINPLHRTRQDLLEEREEGDSARRGRLLGVPGVLTDNGSGDLAIDSRLPADALRTAMHSESVFADETWSRLNPGAKAAMDDLRAQNSRE